METIMQINKIIKDLTDKLGHATCTVTEAPSLSQEQLLIKNFLEERNIFYLIHFTDEKNIPSIKQHGLLSVSQLERQNITYTRNDENRNDHRLDYISLSISGMNEPVYKSFRYGQHTIEHGIAIVINASILYEKIDVPRIYCVTNAATSNASKGSSFNDLLALFSPQIEYTLSSGAKKTFIRGKLGRAEDMPTDPQSEILWKGSIPLDYIYCYWDLEEDFFYGN